MVSMCSKSDDSSLIHFRDMTVAPTEPLCCVTWLQKTLPLQKAIHSDYPSTTTTTIWRPLCRSTCVSSQHLQLRTGGFCVVGAKFYCLHALADGTQCIRWEKTLKFSLTVLSTLSPYLTTVLLIRVKSNFARRLRRDKSKSAFSHFSVRWLM